MQIRTLNFMIIMSFLSACNNLSPTGGPLSGDFQQLEGAALVETFLATPESLAPYQIGSAYEVDGLKYEPEENFAFIVNGFASVYAPDVEGALTASGETYRRSGMTAAHPTLPFQTLVKVTRVDQSRSTVVRINDRGPFALGRVIDLSAAAANDLGISPTAFVEVQLEVLPEETQLFRSALANNRTLPGSTVVVATPQETVVLEDNQSVINTLPTAQAPTEALGKGYFVLVGSYLEPQSANGIRDRMMPLGRTTVEKEGNIFSVYIGPVETELEAQAIFGRVFAEGAVNARVVQK